MFRIYGRTHGRTDRRTNTLAARGLEEPRNPQELLTESVDLTKFVGPLPFSA